MFLHQGQLLLHKRQCNILPINECYIFITVGGKSQSYYYYTIKLEIYRVEKRSDHNKSTSFCT